MRNTHPRWSARSVRSLATGLGVVGAAAVLVVPTAGPAAAAPAATASASGVTVSPATVRAAAATGGRTAAPVASALASISTASLPTTRAVTHGLVVKKPATAVPWAVPLLHFTKADSRSPDQLCSATVISAREVITAAHCIAEPGLYYVSIGGNTIDSGRLVAVEALRANSRYNKTKSIHDIAVLRTLTPIRLRSYARMGTASLAKKIRSSRPPALRLYGWGKNEHDEVDGRLRTAVQRQTNSVADKLFAPFDPRIEIAAAKPIRGSRYAGACSGDSGGPLVVQIKRVSYIVGVTSYGAKRGCDTAPSVFTSVGAYTAWSKAVIKSLPILARKANRALPEPLSPVTTPGTVALGQPLTCTPGAFTANASSVVAAWFRNSDTTALPGGGAHVLEAADAGQKLSCRVTATSRVGSIQLKAPDITVPVGPDANVAPTITGPDPAAAFGTATATCNPGAYTAPGVTIAGYAWFTAYDLNPASKIADGQVLTLTPTLLAALPDGTPIYCQAVAANVMGTVPSPASASVYLNKPTVSVSLPALAKVGAKLSCAATVPQGGAVSFRWAVTSEWHSSEKVLPAQATVVSTAPDYTPSSADVGKFVMCEGTVANGVGSGTDADTTFSRVTA